MTNDIWELGPMQVLLEASEIERVKQLSSNPVDIKPYLSPVGVWEAKHLRHLSHLSGLTYRPNKVNVSLVYTCLAHLTKAYYHKMLIYSFMIFFRAIFFDVPIT